MPFFIACFVEIQAGLTSLATIRRVNGATTRTTGNATAQLDAHDPSQAGAKAASGASARKVAMADTMADINPDRMNPKTTGAKRAGNNA